jgi:peptidoglycan/xylan/chitin deacetylase (PgdA/CDA1 family)
VKYSLIKLLRGRGVILNYHRVLPSNKIDNSLVNISVSTDNFIRQLNYLKNNFDIISLDDLLLHLKNKSNEFKIAITFDDGYSDNLDYAYPILEKFKAPATIYIITKFINNKVIPWWIKLDHFIKNNNKIYGDKKKLFEFYKNNILFRNQLTIDKEILSILGKNNKLRYNKIFLNKKEIQYLSKQKFITIGSHSHSHYNFSMLTQEQTFSEFKTSKSILEKIIKKKIFHFSYPYGGYKNINIKFNNLLKKLGYLSAVTTIRKKLDQHDPFQLPRIFINNDKNLFRLKLKLIGLKKYY